MGEIRETGRGKGGTRREGKIRMVWLVMWESERAR
jgi:hypothetical protein